MPKVSLEIDVTQEQLSAIFALIGQCVPVKVIETPAAPPVQVEATEEPAKPAKKPAKKKDEAKAEAKTEEPAKVETPAVKNDSAYTLDAIRGLIMGALQKIGSAAALQVVQDVAGVRKAADINPTKYAAVAEALNKAVAEHDAVG